MAPRGYMESPQEDFEAEGEEVVRCYIEPARSAPGLWVVVDDQRVIAMCFSFDKARDECRKLHGVACTACQTPCRYRDGL